ncbi:hypothetical protein [Sagittula stellata]|uniref:Uncharacterized protein n=1 Tax=Sagittula stellata (strain ATCC 700073 / DSM 11524 / E-37) TaxID=388399 RepID=A3K3L9_SAGS3|nr:hypothetical protein [Sagittula stellata]EBA08133.1 hypothetical protein SSE37_11334 [Sagittula stellata E-37]
MPFRWLAALFLLCTSANAEVITATDGRQFELNEDGTFSEIVLEAASRAPLEIGEPLFTHNAGNYNQNTVRFMPIVTNTTDKTVVGYRFSTTFRSAFGDALFNFSGESSERISPGATSKASAFYYWEDNQFIGDQPYDKLKIFEANGTGSIETEVTAIAFDDGTFWKAQ